MSSCVNCDRPMNDADARLYMECGKCRVWKRRKITVPTFTTFGDGKVRKYAEHKGRKARSVRAVYQQPYTEREE